ncbi:MAG: hypothetical protein JWP78_1351 [Mucilaginibacter sp.]|nr:hypothetical protein [Mucilaginibacter sp.]
MTNVKLTSKGQAFLAKASSSMALAKKIASKGSGLLSKEGIVVEVGGKSVSARSFANKNFQVK